MTEAPYTVSDLVAEFLAACGVRTAFGIVSVHNIPMLDAVARRNAVRFVPTRGEAGAAHMADGHARAAGALGCAFTSTGPGAANAVAGLVEARFAGTPLLHITGQTSTRFADRGMGSVHDVPDQLGMLRATGKAAFRVRSATEAFGVLVRAATDALTPPMGPVSVEVPIDVQRAAIPRPAALDDFVLPLPPPVAPTSAAMAALVDRVCAARRPMLWLGKGAARAGAAAGALLDLGFGMVTSWAGRGVVDEDHPMNLGALNGQGLAQVEAFYRGVDLLVVAGSRLRGHETGDFGVPLPDNLVQIDVDPLADGRTYPNTLFVRGDAAPTLDRLVAALGDGYRADPDFGAEFRALKRDVRAAFRGSLGPYGDFAAVLRAAMPRDAVWARDITVNNSTWGNKLLPLHDPTTNIYPVGAGIGQGLCLGIGAALAPNHSKTVVLTGDGGFFLNMSELWTAVQERLNLLVIVCNDRGYGVIRHIQDAVADGRRRFDTLVSPDLEGVAALAGLPFRRVADTAEFGPAVTAMMAETGPAIVEVDMTAIGDHPPYYPYGPKVAAAVR